MVNGKRVGNVVPQSGLRMWKSGRWSLKALIGSKEVETSRDVRKSGWTALGSNQLKLNVDAAVILGAGCVGIGAVIRDVNGFVCGALSSILKEVENESSSAIQAIRSPDHSHIRSVYGLDLRTLSRSPRSNGCRGCAARKLYGARLT
ncbi:hypothetical protein TorRG33x02_157670 [Trema orientale]|uniref:RNase H type-1 domain-containing protein n=1 Tax=Trema orientale TaxID=63057 RepID=A0A2P5ES87_TREOI|nr:hypothetical protein TorRG33x02_157670 [Trema orientale]